MSRAADPAPEPSVRQASARQPARRSWLAVRWRQFRNPPPPVLRAVLANLLVASLGGVVLLAYDVLTPAPALAPLIIAFLAAVVVCGSLLTYLWVELPSGSPGVRRRTPWAALLGLFASLPIAYLVLVAVFQVIRPLIG